MTMADPSSASELRASAKQARADRKQSTRAAIEKAAAQTAAMPPPPAPGAQARAGKDKPKPAGARIKKNPKKAALPSDSTDADDRAGPEADSEASTRAGNTKVGTPPRTTAQCSFALPAHASIPQTISNHNCNHKTQTTHHLSNPWTPLGFTDPLIDLIQGSAISKI